MRELNGFALGIVSTVLAAWLYFLTIGHYSAMQLLGKNVLCVW